METTFQDNKKTNINLSTKATQFSLISEAIEKSWAKVAPFWPLKNLIAVNPIQNFEKLPFEQAVLEAKAYFEQKELPQPLEVINRHTIKWVQGFFDEGFSTIAMPLRSEGLYSAWKQLARFDKLFQKGSKTQWVENLPQSPLKAIAACLSQLNISPDQYELFLTLMLTTLPGWAAHIKYRIDWTDGEPPHKHPISAADYLAMRLAITCLVWPQATNLIQWHHQAQKATEAADNPIPEILKNEGLYQNQLLKQLQNQSKRTKVDSEIPSAQFVFCIDVRSEPFRKALESTGKYETFGFAGFFGVPLRIEDKTTHLSFSSCPVLISPKHTVGVSPSCEVKSQQKIHAGNKNLNTIKKLYQSMKYNFTTSFALVETLGLLSGVWLAMKTLSPRYATKAQKKISSFIYPDLPKKASIEAISFEDRCAYAEGALRMMGLTKRFASIICLCGHGSETRNNAYATLLDCGACGGRNGLTNASVLASILNDQSVRKHLHSNGIEIPSPTLFIAGKHNTTTDEVTFCFTDSGSKEHTEQIYTIKRDLKTAQKINSNNRLTKMGLSKEKNHEKYTSRRSVDWAQVRPEWGLASNASFIIAPRQLTEEIDLDGRAFLHSYDYKQDPDGSSLATILTAPMVVAQWINAQYLFSSLNNVAYGGGSKVTQNITGKIGLMQGNASDLMHGLALQSVNCSDKKSYHQPQRLLSVVYAPKELIYSIVQKQEALQKLFQNGWVTLVCIEPTDQKPYFLKRDLKWDVFNSAPS